MNRIDLPTRETTVLILWYYVNATTLTVQGACGNMTRVSEMIMVRAAVPSDKELILPFCQNTFSWGDYIEVVWDQWLADPNGQIIVGVADGIPIAMMHVAILKDGIAWMEGMRVHPDYRRHGAGTKVDAGGRNYARTRGCRVARLATSMKNLPAQAALDTQGYAVGARYAGWHSSPLNDVSVCPHVATESDWTNILGQWNASRARMACRGLLPDPYWRWTELTRERLLEQIHANQVRITRSGFGLFVDSGGEGDSELNIHALVGDAETIGGLALQARGEAAIRGFSRLEAIVAEEPQTDMGLRTAGFAREGGMLVYEQAL